MQKIKTDERKRVDGSKTNDSKHWGSSLEVEDGVAKPAGRRDRRRFLIWYVDEGRRGVAVDDVVGEEAPTGWRTEEGVGLRGFSRPRCTNWWADGMGVGNHGLGMRLFEMWGKLRKYRHRFEVLLSV